MPKYNIRLKHPDGHIELKEVTGYPVSVPWSDKVDLFIHRPTLAPTTWTISEAKTGLALLQNCHGTKKQAVEALISHFSLGKLSRKTILERIKEYVSENGVANRVTNGVTNTGQAT